MEAMMNSVQPFSTTPQTTWSASGEEEAAEGAGQQAGSRRSPLSGCVADPISSAGAFPVKSIFSTSSLLPIGRPKNSAGRPCQPA
jgi:hypothetical protein